MKKIRVFDPALCCSTGVCGVEVDQSLVNFSADVDWAKSRGAQIERFNLAQQPMAFVESAAVKDALERSGQGALPLIIRDGKIALSGRYPTRDELAQWTDLATSQTDPRPAAAVAGTVTPAASCCRPTTSRACCPAWAHG